MEIKTLLADLLGLEAIRALGAKALETAKLLKTGLLAVRQERTGLKAEVEQVAREFAQLGDTGARIAAAESGKAAKQAALDTAKEELAKHATKRDVAVQTEARRNQLTGESRSIIEAGKAALGALDAQDRREGERLDQLIRRISQRAEDERKRRKGLTDTASRWKQRSSGGVSSGPSQRLGWRRAWSCQREERVAGLRRDVERMRKCVRPKASSRASEIAGIEREAGQASFEGAGLSRRFGLPAEVPCAGTDLQGRASCSPTRARRKASSHADAQIARLQEARAKVATLKDIEAQGLDFSRVPQSSHAAERLKLPAEQVGDVLVAGGKVGGDLGRIREMLAAD